MAIEEGYIHLDPEEMWITLARDVAALVDGDRLELHESSHYALGRYVKFNLGLIEVKAWPCVPASGRASVVLFIVRPARFEVPDENERIKLVADVADRFFTALIERYGDRLQFDDWQGGGQNADFEVIFATHQSDKDEQAFD
ncbi:MAG: hypothetical protein FWD68_21385 [Alphaproteobacteria bacterium]|nr:hypothetical protein [Alphaproteobacteria bacterium]